MQRSALHRGMAVVGAQRKMVREVGFRHVRRWGLLPQPAPCCLLACVVLVGLEPVSPKSGARSRVIKVICSPAAWLVIGSLWAAGPSLAADLPVDLELVLAVDVSGSIDAEEARQQRDGYVAAIADPAVIQAIRANFHQRIAVAYVEWSSPDYQRVVIDWTVIEDAGSADEFAAALAAEPVSSARWTSISGAIDFAVPLFDGNGYAGERQVIDISGDGPNNRGRPVTLARDEALAQGTVINGLPILNDRRQPFDLPTPNEVALDDYYRDNVVGGPGSFVTPVQDFDGFRTAILSKLIREIAAAPMPPVDLTLTAGSRNSRRRYAPRMRR